MKSSRVGQLTWKVKLDAMESTRLTSFSGFCSVQIPLRVSRRGELPSISQGSLS